MARTLEALSSAATKGKPSSFPFHLSKYPTFQHIHAPLNIPRETYAGYPKMVTKSFADENAHPECKRRMTTRPYFLKYQMHELDVYSIATSSVGLIGRLRAIENHLARVDDDDDMRIAHKIRRHRLTNNLRKLRIENFSKYWRMTQDFKLWDLTAQTHQGFLDLGAFITPGPHSGLKASGVEQYMDPEILYGCEETGETRFAVSRRLGKLFSEGMSVYARDRLDGLWKLGDVQSVDVEAQRVTVALLASNDVIEANFDDARPVDAWATSRPMGTNDPVRSELAEETNRFVYFENLKKADPTRFEQEWYQHICQKYYDGKAPTGSFRGWRQRFMVWDPQTKSHKQVRWVKGLSKYMQRRVYLGYPVRTETFTGGIRGRSEPWWVQATRDFRGVTTVAPDGQKMFKMVDWH